MSIHFAASRRRPGSALARHLTVPRSMQAVNDNHGEGDRAIIDNPLLRATLEHFAAHGLGAAAEARNQAEDAFLSEDAESYRHWLAVCRMLDRRMAGRLARRPPGA
ncbi:hypothetical protein ACFOON_08335 [Novosphingobium piscinae]|uniref:Uncharacterized protein n=1 Tax=Novosphingobium piscinae TaxID=1507448 RepID=A0A7X1KRL4_9SPHN|nr:hypothetical protein [Novosphingobium piscinae]MBC2670949.1 hypothetical protein [Novosphingobium piscinae]